MGVFEEHHGDVAERPNAPVLKTGEVIPPRVQIPPSPQYMKSCGIVVFSVLRDFICFRGFILMTLVCAFCKFGAKIGDSAPFALCSTTVKREQSWNRGN